MGMAGADPRHEAIPKHTMFNVGKDHLPGQTATPIIGIIERRSSTATEGEGPDQVASPDVLLCQLANTGAVDLSITVEQSADNLTSGDAYAAKSIRVDGADVAGGTLTVVPGGRTVFLIEWALDDDNFLKFETDSTPDATGELTIAHYDGTLIPFARIRAD